MMNNNCHEYKLSMEFLLLCCNKPFHFCSQDTYITFLLINIQNKRHVNMNRAFQVIGLLQSSLVLFILTPSALTEWLTQITVDCIILIKVSNVMMNDNCHEYESKSMEFLLLCCNKPFHFCSQDTYIKFLLINIQNKRHVNMNRTFQVIGLLQSSLLSFIVTPSALTEWLTQISVDCIILIKVK